MTLTRPLPLDGLHLALGALDQPTATHDAASWESLGDTAAAHAASAVS